MEGSSAEQDKRGLFGLTPYLSKTMRQNLFKYKYAGGDNGIVWNLFYNPVSKFLVNFVPETVAPNVITLVAFIVYFIPFLILFVCFGTKFQNEKDGIPNWYFFLQAFAYLTYRILDEMDGKQARRTGNSSPLGLLFDHGCDAFTMGFVALTISKCFQTGDSYFTLFTVMVVCSSFHFSTLEEYYTGGLFLGPGNGVTDGSVVIIGLFIAMGFYGNDFMLNKVYGDIQLSHMMCIALWIGNSLLNISCII